MNSSSRSWFFTPPPEQYSKRDSFDWLSVIRLIGRPVEEAFSRLIIQNLDPNVIMMAPAVHDERYCGDPDDADLAVTSKMVETYCSDDMERITRIVPNVEQGAVSLAFEIKLKSGKLVYLDEYSLGRTFDSDMASPSKAIPLLGEIVRRMEEDFRREGGAPYAYSNLRHLDCAEYWRNRVERTLTRMSGGEAAVFAKHLAEENSLPMLVNGQLFGFEPDFSDVDVPELVNSEVEEAKKLNPHFGALSF